MTGAKHFACVLLTNDDGIDAPGMAVLESVAETIADQVWVVAPERDQSGISHAVTLHHPLRADPRGLRRFAVSGTPSDCVALGLSVLMDGQKPDLILSGVNRGANIADDIAYSGTIGAAVTATLLGYRAAALSQAYTKELPMRWNTARSLAPDILTRLFRDADFAADACMNINFPDCEPADINGVSVVRQGTGTIRDIIVDRRTDLRGGDYHWLSFSRGQPGCEPGTDAEALRDNRIAIAPIRAERTHEQALAQIEAQLAKCG